MIKKAIKAIKNIFIPPIEYRNFEDDIECAVDETKVSCDTLGDVFYSPEAQGTWYTGVPAPAYLKDDPWFGSPVYSEKQKDYMEIETEMKIREEQQRREASVEPEDIHQKMYEIATKSWNTVSETQGGSENFHQGPGGWNSGNGMGQFQK